MITFMNIADLKDPDDPEGRTYRQVNAAKQHAIPLRTLVERPDGVRLWVVKHTRDCDQTPLYSLTADYDDFEPDAPEWAYRKWMHGCGEEYLRVIRGPLTAEEEDEFLG